MRRSAIFTAMIFGVWLDPVFSAQELRRVVQASAPEYPDLMHAAQIQEKFVVTLTVSASGDVSDAVVVESPAPYFDPQITAHVRRWQFEPQDSSSVLSVQFVFRLLPRKTPVEERGVFFVAPTTIEIRTREPHSVTDHTVTRE